jgi:hypothetical protein
MKQRKIFRKRHVRDKQDRERERDRQRRRKRKERELISQIGGTEKRRKKR